MVQLAEKMRQVKNMRNAKRKNTVFKIPSSFHFTAGFVFKRLFISSLFATARH
jgi:hypothetical protein